jgi:hypothetical protein
MVTGVWPVSGNPCLESFVPNHISLSFVCTSVSRNPQCLKVFAVYGNTVLILVNIICTIRWLFFMVPIIKFSSNANIFKVQLNSL